VTVTYLKWNFGCVFASPAGKPALHRIQDLPLEKQHNIVKFETVNMQRQLNRYKHAGALNFRPCLGGPCLGATLPLEAPFSPSKQLRAYLIPTSAKTIVATINIPRPHINHNSLSLDTLSALAAAVFCKKNEDNQSLKLHKRKDINLRLK
jgi:hypothetical protein